MIFVSNQQGHGGSQGSLTFILTDKEAIVGYWGYPDSNHAYQPWSIVVVEIIKPSFIHP